jgi:hypothetical protein
MKERNTFVSNLLAVIHGDGGHYENKYGTEKACADAEKKIYELYNAREMLKEIEALIPDWKNYRDLAEAVQTKIKKAIFSN